MNKHTIVQQSIDHLQQLIGFNSESELSNLPIINYIKQCIKQEDRDSEAHIHLSHSDGDEQKKASILISLPDHTGSISDGILLSGHTDVVPVAGQHWQTNPYTMMKKNHRLYGRGSCDMKGFIAVCLAMFSSFKKNLRKQPIHMAFTYDEEVGCLGAKRLCEDMRALNIIPHIAIIGEPTEMGVVIGHKGCCEYRTHVTGLPGHSSLPDTGVNAIEYAINYANELFKLRTRLIKQAPTNPFHPPYTTLQIGKIQGGSAHNVIAEHCSIDWQFRPIQQQDYDTIHQHMDDYANQSLLPQMHTIHPEASIDKEVISDLIELKPTQDSTAAKYLCRLTGKTHTNVVSYGTEAGIFQRLGCSAVVCGPGSITQAHKADEFIGIDQLEQCADMLLSLQQDICQ